MVITIDQFRGCISISDIMELLYGKMGRRVTNITSVLLSTVLVVAQAKAIGYLLCIIFTYHLRVV
ncbi:MAG: hypothetical protein AB8U91_02640 [Candidatus Midichloria sp.]|uniref:Sodium:solute symporter family protein n=1 Tax=Hyalomma marginatum TaxID=34627 RepID=A0A8S4BVU0_9ACAR|nr:sodium:solute symporter family protein [Hyalomma marginatum]CAG7596737.1 sodium:solute symporter family protein [Hyalomma marginatum]